MSEELLPIIERITEPVTWALIHSLWQGGLVALILAAGLWLLRGRSPRLRYAMSCGAMLTLVFMAVITAIHIGSHHQSLSSMATAAATSDLVSEVLPADATIAIDFSAPVREHWGLASLTGPRPWLPWFFMAWLAGATLFSARHILGWRKARHLTRRCIGDAPAVWQERFDSLCRSLRIDRPVELVTSAIVKAPCVVGWARPTVLVPVSLFTGMSVHHLELILMHELAHIRRWDVLINYLQTAVETLLFFNPAMWWISRQIREEREHCCDDLVVAASGDRLPYARALADMERLRATAPLMAVGADGGSLLHRVQRLLGRSHVSSYRPLAGTTGVFVLTAILTVALVGAAAMISESAQARADAEVYEPSGDDIKGRWEVERRRDEPRVTLTIDYRRRSSSSFSVRLDQLPGLEYGSDVRFQLHRDAGIFYFEGEYEKDGRDSYGTGTCYFRLDPDYEKEMERLGYELGSDQQIMHLALFDVTADFARGLADAGLEDMPTGKLVDMRIHDVTPEYVKEMTDLGYDRLTPSRLIEMQIHNVSPEYVRAMLALGLDDISPSKLIEMNIHDVTPEYVRALKDAGYDDLRPSRLIEMSIHDVDPVYAAEMSKLEGDLVPASRLVEMSIHGVTPEYVRAMQESGYDNLRPSSLIELRIHGVDPDFVRELAELGYDNIPSSKLLEMHIHDVDPEFIRELQRAGYTDISTSRLVEMSIHDVSPAYVRALAEAGYTDLSPARMVEMSIHDVDPEWLRRLGELGYDNISPSRLVEMSIHNVEAEYVAELIDLGYDDISPSKLVEMRIHNVEPEYVRELAELGYADLRPSDLVSMRIHNVTADFIRELQEAGLDDLSPEDIIDEKIGTGRSSYRSRRY